MLPDNVLSSNTGGSTGSSDGSSGNIDNSSSSNGGVSTGAVVGGVVGGLALLAIIAAGGIFFLRKRRSSVSKRRTYSQGPSYSASSRGGPGYSLAANSLNANVNSAAAAGALGPRGHMMAPSDSSSLIPLNQETKSPGFGDPSMGMAYKDDSRTSVGGLGGYPMQEVHYDPYARDTGSGQNRF